MATNTSNTSAVAVAQRNESRRMEARTRFENGVVIGEDEFRAAQLGKLQELPSMGEALEAWLKQRDDEACEDYAVDFRNVLLAPDGRLDVGQYDEQAALVGRDHGTNDRSDKDRFMPMTYRTFGNLIRHYCSPPRNSAQNLIQLPRAQDPHAHTGRTMRAGTPPAANANWSGALPDSPRAIAYNAWLDKKKRTDQTVTSLTGAPATTAIFRSRLLTRRDSDGNKVASARTVVGVVSPDHCLRDGDDDKLIAALTLAFAGHANSARGAAYRGVEESELRVLFPALDVSVPDTGDGSPDSSLWMGYLTARNSESGMRSWNIRAGLYREVDGASVACEAVVRTGRHVGKRVAERMVEVAEGAATMLQDLLKRAAELAGRVWKGSEAKLLERLRGTLNGTVLHDPDVCCGLAWSLGSEVGAMNDPVTVGTLMNVLGRAAAACERRADARPVEVMLGRVLMNGWDEFHAVATERSEDGSDQAEEG